VDQAKLDANIAAMADFAAKHNLRLRPHVKTTKLLNAGRQLSVGSDRLSVATLGESQYFFDAGVTDLLFVYLL